MINLIDHKGKQETIGRAFTRLVRDLNMDDVNYEWFDFHRECKSMKWENISKLLEKLTPDMENFDYFMALIDTSDVITYLIMLFI